MPVICITGGTGLTGRALTKSLLDKGYSVIICSRDPQKAKANNFGLLPAKWKNLTESKRVSFAAWDPARQYIEKEAIAGADHIISLAGAGVGDKRWTNRRKKEIVSSRVEGGKLIADSLQKIPNSVQSVISASAIGYYLSPGNKPEAEDKLVNRPRIETDPPAKDFLGQTCSKWEESIQPIKQSGKRLVIFRTGIILSNEGGVLPAFKKPLDFGLAAIMGNGKQVISWIHIKDLVKLYITAIENENIKGIYNAVSPLPVTNKAFVLQLAKIKKGRWFIPFYMPSFLLKIMLGEMSTEILKSNSVSCQKLLDTGFMFQYPELREALINLLTQTKQ